MTDNAFHTPVIIHQKEDQPLPDEPGTHYVLSSNGLFIVRNTPFYQSCVPARDFPAELGQLLPSMKVDFPRLSQEDIELVVGFFSRIAEKYENEAGVLIGHDMADGSTLIIVPPQKVGVNVDTGEPILSLTYEFPQPGDLPPTVNLIGTIHSHVYHSAYASGTDEHDEDHFPGIHVVAGRLDQDPPEWHAEAIADGVRFQVDPQTIIGEYQKRNELDVPDEWIENVSQYNIKIQPAKGGKHHHQIMQYTPPPWDDRLFVIRDGQALEWDNMKAQQIEQAATADN